MKKYTIIGFLVSIGIISGLVWLSGYQQFVSAFVRVNLSLLASILLIGLTTLLTLALVMKMVFAIGGREISFRKIVPAYFSSNFLNCITPLGQAGGEPASAFIFNRRFDIPYEESLATIMINDLIYAFIFVPFLFASLIAAFFITTSLNALIIISIGLFFSIAISGILILSFTTYRDKVKKLILWVGGKVNKIVTLIKKIKPNFKNDLIDRQQLKQRIDNFFSTIDLFKENLNQLKAPLAVASLSFLFKALVSLLLLKTFLGGSLSYLFPISILVITLSSFAFYLPLPGGAGGVEAAYATVLVFFTALPLSLAAAVALLYRISFYWLPIILGGLSLGGISGDIVSKT